MLPDMRWLREKVLTKNRWSRISTGQTLLMLVRSLTRRPARVLRPADECPVIHKNHTGKNQARYKLQNPTVIQILHRYVKWY